MMKADWYFIIPATIVWVASLLVTGWDFIVLQGAIYTFKMINIVGLGLLVTGMALRVASRITLARNYSYVLRDKPSKKLITKGVYKFIRHPIYLAALLYVMGTPLIFASIYGLLVTFGFIPCILYRIRIEEKLLIEQFGEQYIAYKRQTKKLIPFLY